MTFSPLSLDSRVYSNPRNSILSHAHVPSWALCSILSAQDAISLLLDLINYDSFLKTTFTLE